MNKNTSEPKYSAIRSAQQLIAFIADMLFVLGSIALGGLAVGACFLFSSLDRLTPAHYLAAAGLVGGGLLAMYASTMTRLTAERIELDLSNADALKAIAASSARTAAAVEALAATVRRPPAP